MNRRRRFCPTVRTLEDRVALSSSFSFTNMLHSLLPFLPDNSNKPAPKPHHAAAVVSPLHAGSSAHTSRLLAFAESHPRWAQAHHIAIPSPGTTTD
jgi:hypothetical protein